MPAVPPCRMQLSAVEQQQRDRDGAERVHQRRGDGLDGDRTHVSREQPVGCAAKAVDLPALHAECLHDRIAHDGFLHDVLDLGQLVLPAPSRLAHAAANARVESTMMGTKMSSTQDMRPPTTMTAPTMKISVKSCCRKSLMTPDIAVCTRSTSLMSVEMRVPDVCAERRRWSG